MRCVYLMGIYDGGTAWGCNGKALTEARALRRRVMMRLVIILIVLLLISFGAY